MKKNNTYQYYILFGLIFFFITIYVIYNKILYNQNNNQNNNQNVNEFFNNLNNNLDSNQVNDFGFIITRHVNSEETNKYWITCLKNIRKFYNDTPVVIIDDNSNPTYLKNLDAPLDNCTIINSEYPRRGELLPYYYLYKKKLFKKAVVIHDSIFFIKHIDFSKYDNCKFLFHFTHEHDEDNEIIKLLKHLKGSDDIIKEYLNKDKWYMCFGVMSVISLNFITLINGKYDFFNLLNYIDTRQKRMALERIFGLLCTLENNELKTDPSIFGMISELSDNFNYYYKNYVEDEKNKKLENKFDIVKVWTGR